MSFKRFKPALLLLLAGCVTVPRDRAAVLWWEFLPQAPILVYGKMAPVRSYLLEKTADKTDFHDIFRRTTDFYASLVPGKEPKFALMGLGDFPRGLTQWALSWNAAWKRGPEPPEQYIHNTGSLAVTVPEDGVVLASNSVWTSTGVAEPVRSVSEAAAMRALQSDLFLYLPRPGTLLLGDAGERLPLVSVLMPLNAEANQWSGAMEFDFENERQARLALTLLRLSAGNWMGTLTEWGVILDPDTITWTVDGTRAVVGPVGVPFGILDATLALIEGEEP